MRLAGFFEVHAPESMSRLVTFLLTVAAIVVALRCPGEAATVGVLLGGSAAGLGLRGKTTVMPPPPARPKHPDAELADDVP